MSNYTDTLYRLEYIDLVAFQSYNVESCNQIGEPQRQLCGDSYFTPVGHLIIAIACMCICHRFIESEKAAYFPIELSYIIRGKVNYSFACCMVLFLLFRYSITLTQISHCHQIVRSILNQTENCHVDFNVSSSTDIIWCSNGEFFDNRTIDVNSYISIVDLRHMSTFAFVNLLWTSAALIGVVVSLRMSMKIHFFLFLIFVVGLLTNFWSLEAECNRPPIGIISTSLISALFVLKGIAGHKHASLDAKNNLCTSVAGQSHTCVPISSLSNLKRAFITKDLNLINIDDVQNIANYWIAVVSHWIASTYSIVVYLQETGLFNNKVSAFFMKASGVLQWLGLLILIHSFNPLYLNCAPKYTE